MTRVFLAIAAACAVACGGANGEEFFDLGNPAISGAGGNRSAAAAGSAGNAVSEPAAGGSSDVGAGGAKEAEAGAGGAEPGEEDVAGAAQGGSGALASGGASSAAYGGQSVSMSGNGGAADGASAGAAGAGGASDPACAPSNLHAVPAKCAGAQPIDCNANVKNNPNVCTGGAGLCPDDTAKECRPYEDDFSLCRDGRFFSCPAGTCGTAAGAKCKAMQSDVIFPPEFCPCVVMGIEVASG